MNYRAACPHCASVFRLGDHQLAAADGWVQCGVCGVAFDARRSLLMEDGSSLPRANEPEAPIQAEPSQTAPAPIESAPPGALPADSPEHEATPVPANIDDAPADGVHQTGDSAPPADTDRPRGLREREDPSDLPSIILIDPNLPSYDEPGPMPVIRSVPAQDHAPSPVNIRSSPAITLASPAAPTARIEYAQSTPARSPRSAPRHRPKPRLVPWLGGMTALLLLFSLLAQVAWFQRDTLATQFPALRPWLEQACTRLGCTLSLPRQLDQIRIIGSDLSTETNGQLRLTLTLGNQANHAMAWPVLVLTLTDQAGKPLARRSFAPSEYLADPDRIASGMPPLTEQPLTLPLAVRDLAPMGFDLRLAY